MSAIPYMPLWVSDYLADTQDFSTEEHGAYMLLIMTYWQRGEPLPNDPERLARVARLSNERWTAVEPTLKRMFNVTANEWTHKRIDAELTRARNKIEKARESGKKSAESRKSNPEATDVERTLSERSSGRPTTSESDSLLSIITAQSTEQGPARAKPAAPKSEPKNNFGSKGKVDARAKSSTDVDALDSIVKRAEGFMLDVDAVRDLIRKNKPKNPAGYAITVFANDLKSRVPLATIETCTAAMRGKTDAQKAVYEAMTI